MLISGKWKSIALLFLQSRAILVVPVLWHRLFIDSNLDDMLQRPVFMSQWL